MTAWQGALAGAPYNHRHRILVAGNIKWVVERADLERDANGTAIHGVGTVQDITEAKYASQLLRDALELNRRIIEESPAGIFLFRGDGRCIIANPAARRMAGTSGGALRPVESFNFRSSASWLRVGLFDDSERVLKDGTPRIGEYHFVSTSGQDIWIEAKQNRIPLNNEHHLLAIFTDVRKYREAEAAQAEAAKIAQSANRAKSEFLANMSHEIRTPMNAILGLAHLARDEAESPAMKDYLRKITSACTSLLSILNDILDLSKIEAGRVPISSTPFSLSEIVDNACHLFQPQAARKGLVMTVDVAPDIPENFLGDALRIGQILNNLLSNAIKFTERGSVDIKVRKLTSPTAGFIRLQFSVADTGIGIEPDQIDRLFQPFEQADATTTRRYGGTGLGLAISRRLASLMGGTIRVESWPGSGSVFFLEIELASHSPLKLSEARVQEYDLPHPDNLPGSPGLEMVGMDTELASPVGSNGQGAKSDLEMQLTRLEFLLERNELVSNDWVDLLRRSIPASLSHATDDLGHALSRFDYTEARDCLRHIRRTLFPGKTQD